MTLKTCPQSSRDASLPLWPTKTWRWSKNSTPQLQPEDFANLLRSSKHLVMPIRVDGRWSVMISCHAQNALTPAGGSTLWQSLLPPPPRGKPFLLCLAWKDADGQDGQKDEMAFWNRLVTRYRDCLRAVALKRMRKQINEETVPALVIMQPRMVNAADSNLLAVKRSSTNSVELPWECNSGRSCVFVPGDSRVCRRSRRDG